MDSSKHQNQMSKLNFEGIRDVTWLARECYPLKSLGTTAVDNDHQNRKHQVRKLTTDNASVGTAIST